MVERVFEERAAGNPALAAEIRTRVAGVIGDSLRDLLPGSAKAAEVKALLQNEGLWSQYLELGIGPDAEVFTKEQPMAAIEYGASVGFHSISKWDNPKPEVVLVVSSIGQIVGTTFGNDVNLRDVEGRSALLLVKAKDNNAAASIGPFIQLFDADFTLIPCAGWNFRCKARRRCARSAATLPIWWRKRGGVMTNIRTALCSVAARCSRQCKTEMGRGRALPTIWAIW